MNTKRKVLVGAIAALAMAPFAQQASAAPSKLYHWVGADGKDHYSDVIPPEALGQARQELSGTSGVVIKQVDRAKTPEEIAAAQAQAAAEAQAEDAATKAKDSDQALLSSYPTEADLQRAFDQRIELQNDNLKSTRVGVGSVQQSLTGLLTRANGDELAGRHVADDLVAQIAKTRNQLLGQQAQLVRLEVLSVTIKQENAAQIARYRSLRAAVDAANAPAAPVPPPPNR